MLTFLIGMGVGAFLYFFFINKNSANNNIHLSEGDIIILNALLVTFETRMNEKLKDGQYSKEQVDLSLEVYYVIDELKQRLDNINRG